MSKKILVVEDDRDLLELLTDVLNREGYEVVGISYTSSIIDTVTEHQPDLVMLDFLLPGINGGELCHELKVHPDLGKIPVIMLSGFPRVLESLGDYGSNGFIAKPFDINEVTDMVQKLTVTRKLRAVAGDWQ